MGKLHRQKKYSAELQGKVTVLSDLGSQKVTVTSEKRNLVENENICKVFQFMWNYVTLMRTFLQMVPTVLRCFFACPVLQNSLKAVMSCRRVPHDTLAYRWWGGPDHNRFVSHPLNAVYKLPQKFTDNIISDRGMWAEPDKMEEIMQIATCTQKHY